MTFLERVIRLTRYFYHFPHVPRPSSMRVTEVPLLTVLIGLHLPSRDLASHIVVEPHHCLLILRREPAGAAADSCSVRTRGADAEPLVLVTRHRGLVIPRTITSSDNVHPAAMSGTFGASLACLEGFLLRQLEAGVLVFIVADDHYCFLARVTLTAPANLSCASKLQSEETMYDVDKIRQKNRLLCLVLLF